jgi:hypothetical protein
MLVFAGSPNPRDPSALTTRYVAGDKNDEYITIRFPVMFVRQLLIQEQDTPAASMITELNKIFCCAEREEKLSSSEILQASPIGHLTDPPFQSCKIQIEGAPARSRLNRPAGC